ncbi:hypothetical protein AB5I41_05655 [Sphingomonas sp. MMS24-JH45]
MPRLRRPAAFAFATYAVCVYPANVQHAMIDLTGGTGLGLWYRAPPVRAAAAGMVGASVAKAWRDQQ